MDNKKSKDQIATHTETASHFDNKWWTREDALSKRLYIVKDLLKMLDGERLDLKTSPAVINRGFFTCDYINKNIRKGAKILEMACGYGFVTHVLTEKEYSVVSFDISKESITSAKEEALKLDQNPNIFNVADENFLSQQKDSSFDVIIGLGYLRYLDDKAQKFVYENMKRILKPNGIVIIDHQNDLYEMFALNNESIMFWADLISNYCDLNNIYKEGELLDALNKNISTPIRKRKGHSFSGKYGVFSENPLIYEEKVKSFGFDLIDLIYPHCDIIPPFLQGEVNKEELELIQRKNCVDLARNWKSMFMCYQFLSFIKKP